MKDKFKQHFEKYNTLDKNIMIRYYHSLRVCDLSYDIAKNLNLTDEEIYIATIIGLLHDYARFEQWQLYGTYNDKDSIDHGDLAVKMLFEDNEIKDYLEDEKYYPVIYDAIKYHNKLEVADDVSNKMFCNIIRDADKIDIFYLHSIDKSLVIDTDDKISKEVERNFYENKLVEGNKVKNNNDKILYHLSYIYDINYKYSYKYIYENKIIEKIYENINNKEKFKKYFEYAIKYIQERID